MKEETQRRRDDEPELDRLNDRTATEDRADRSDDASGAPSSRRPSLDEDPAFAASEARLWRRVIATRRAQGAGPGAALEEANLLLMAYRRRRAARG